MDEHNGWLDRTLTVSQLCRSLKDLFDDVGLVRVEGELSQFTAHRSGHWYFTLRDAQAVLNCVMFRGLNQYVRRPPQVGDRVTVTGSLDLYAPQGKLNLLVRALESAGEGDLAARKEALKRKLAAEGLFDQARKRPIPVLPRAIGVATSPTGAAFQDILKVLGRRFPGLTVYLAPCRVQGDSAPAEVAAAIDLLNAHGGSDVLIIGRGGGSAEDLAAFDSEAVARAVFRSQIPVVSAVGHEVDVSIADLVADLRAATPSHAAELVVPEREGLLMALDELDERQRQAMARLLRRRREQLAALRPRHPAERIARDRQRLLVASQRLPLALQATLQRRRAALDLAGRQLQALSPDRVLERGYAVLLKDGAAVVDTDQLQAGDRLQARLHRGRATLSVQAVEG